MNLEQAIERARTALRQRHLIRCRCAECGAVRWFARWVVVRSWLDECSRALLASSGGDVVEIVGSLGRQAVCPSCWLEYGADTRAFLRPHQVLLPGVSSAVTWADLDHGSEESYRALRVAYRKRRRDRAFRGAMEALEEGAAG